MTDPSQAPRSPRVSPEGDHFVLVQLPSGEERLEPLLNLGPRGLAILLRTQRVNLQPGTTLPRVRIFSGGACTLDATASVREVGQVSLEDGTIALRVGLSLKPTDQPQLARSSVDTYDQSTIVEKAAAHMAQLGIEVAVVPDGEGPRTVLAAGPIADLDTETQTLRLRTETPAQTLEPGVTYLLRGEPLGRRVALHGEFRERDGQDLVFGPVDKVTVWQHRGAARLRALPEPIRVRFETPFTQRRETRQAVDLAARGVAFRCEPDDALMVGMLLPGLSIHLPKGEVRASGVIRHVRYDDNQDLIVGVELTDLDKKDAERLARYVDAHIHPLIRMASPEDLRALWLLYEDARAIPPETVWAPNQSLHAHRDRLLRRGAEIFVQVVGGSDGSVRGAAEMLRTYENTWTLQNLVFSDHSRLTVDQMLVPLTEAVSRVDARCIWHVWLSARDWESLHDLEPDPDVVSWRRWRVYRAAEDYTSPTTLAADVTAANDAAGHWIELQLQAKFADLERKGLSLGSAPKVLSRIKKMYRGAGLERSRHVRLATSITTPLGLAVVDHVPLGTNLDGVSSVARIVGSDPEGLVSLAHDAIAVGGGEPSETRVLLGPEHNLALDEVAGLQVERDIVEVLVTHDAPTQLVNLVHLLGT